MTINQENLLEFLKRNGINPKKLPSEMPEDLQELITDTLDLRYDYDEEDEDEDEVKELKESIRKAVKETIEEVKKYLKEQEMTVPLTKDEKIRQEILKLKPQEGPFLISNEMAFALGIVKSRQERGVTRGFGFVFKRADYDLKWSVQDEA